MKSPKTYNTAGSFLLDYSAASSSSRRSPRRRPAAASSVHVVVVATHADDSFMPLLYGCAILDVKVRVIGWKEELKGSREGWRARKILDLCEELDEDEVVAVVDSFCGLALQHREVILDKFQEFRGRIVCMASRAPAVRERCSFFPSFGGRKAEENAAGSRIPVIGDGDPGLHAGAFIGYAGSIARVLAKARQENTSVQALFSSLYRGKPNEIISIDVNCSIFHQCHSSSSIRILSYAEAHAVAVHQSPQLSIRSPPAIEELSHFSNHPGSCPHLPHSSHPPKWFFPKSSWLPVSLKSEHASSWLQKPSPAPGRQQCITRPAPFFRPSPLEKIAMDAATGETPCFLHFSDRVCAAQILTKLEFFAGSQHRPPQRHQQEHLQQHHCQRQSLAQNYYTWLFRSASGRNCRLRRILDGMTHLYAACGILRALLYTFLLGIRTFGINTSLSYSGFYGLLPGNFVAKCNSLFQIANAMTSTAMTCCVVPIVQAFNYVKSITTFWLSIFLSCCVVGLCGAACCGSSKEAEEQSFHEWQKGYGGHEVGVGASASLVYDEQRQQSRQENVQVQERDKGMRRHLRHKHKEKEQQRTAAEPRLEEDMTFGVECGAKEKLPLAAQLRKRSCSSRRHEKMRHQGARQQVQQQEDSNQQLLSHKTQQQEQLQQNEQAMPDQDSPQPFQNTRLISFHQHRRPRRSVSRTRAVRTQRSRVRVNAQVGTLGKKHNSSDPAAGCLSLTPPLSSLRAVTRRTRAASKGIAAAVVAGA